MENDNNALREKLQSSHNELVNIQNSYDLITQNLSTLREAAKKQENEKLTLQTTYQNIILELEQYRNTDSILRQLNRDLELSNISTISQSAVSSPSRPGTTAPVISFSHRHLGWTSLSSVQNTCPLLYDRIRSLLNDLQTKEMECQELSSLVQTMKREREIRLRQQDENDSMLKNLYGMKSIYQQLRQLILLHRSVNNNQGSTDDKVIQQCSTVLLYNDVSFIIVDTGQ